MESGRSKLELEQWADRAMGDPCFLFRDCCVAVCIINGFCKDCDPIGQYENGRGGQNDFRDSWWGSVTDVKRTT